MFASFLCCCFCLVQMAIRDSVGVNFYGYICGVWPMFSFRPSSVFVANKINEALIYCATYLALNWRTLSANVSVILLDRIRTIPCECMCERVFVSVPKYIEYIRLIMMVVVDRWMDGWMCVYFM